MNIKNHLKDFQDEMLRRNYSPCTIHHYSNNISCFFEWSTKDHPKNINEKDIKLYLAQFKEPNTQKCHHSAIKLFYKIVLRQKNKFRYIPYVRKSRRLPIVLSKDEIQKMFSVCKNLKHLVILSLLYACGFRASELKNLKWANLDRNRKVINVIGKGQKDRHVSFPEVLIPLLTIYYRKYKPQIYVLNGQNNNPQYSITSIRLVIKHLAIKAGISKRVCTHLMRHCCFSHMLEDGVELRFIQEAAGHNDIRTTQIYCHISDTFMSKIKSPINNININLNAYKTT